VYFLFVTLEGVLVFLIYISQVIMSYRCAAGRSTNFLTVLCYVESWIVLMPNSMFELEIFV